MSDSTAIALVLGLLALEVLTYNQLEKRAHVTSEAIFTGVSRGVPIPVWHRRWLLQLPWLVIGGLQIAYTSIAAIAWWVFGGNASGQEIRLLAYLMAFFSLIGAVGWMGVMPFWYIRLASVLRQAEAD